MAEKRKLTVKVLTTENVLFEGEAERISSFNEVGPFDVFPMHANFISIIRRGLSLYHNKIKVKDLQFDQAVMKVKQDIVNIFLGLEALLVDETNQKEEPAAPPQK